MFSNFSATYIKIGHRIAVCCTVDLERYSVLLYISKDEREMADTK